MEINEFKVIFERLKNEIEKYIHGQQETIWFMTAVFMVRGHLLLEGFPGTAKTILVKILSRITGLDMARIQGTPDLMPGDIIGSLVFHQGIDRLEWNNGPIFDGNIIFIDEINRMNPRTQSVTLQAMQEGQVRVLGQTNEGNTSSDKNIKKPNMFIATMNPIEQEGTYPLPEAQLDRFTAKIVVPNPSKYTLKTVLENYSDRHKTDQIINEIEVLNDWRDQDIEKRFDQISDLTSKVEAGDHLQTIVDIIDCITPFQQENKTEKDEFKSKIQFGGSPRGAQAILQLARIKAMTENRQYIEKSDIKYVLIPTLQHRINLKYDAEIDEGLTPIKFIDNLKKQLL